MKTGNELVLAMVVGAVQVAQRQRQAEDEDETLLELLWSYRDLQKNAISP